MDADRFKEKLLREALADGSYETFLKPEGVREREEAGEPFFPSSSLPSCTRSPHTWRACCATRPCARGRTS
ncbi:hypothetical protein NKG05_30855 [Oerskovia sp. M15]